jgi:hypothetical protein
VRFVSDDGNLVPVRQLEHLLFLEDDRLPRLAHQARGAVGTTYHVWRRIGPSGPFTCLGATGVKKFVDETLPQGLAQVTYQIQAVRSTKAGPWARFDVNFGTGDRRVSWMALSTPPMTPLAAA